MKKLLSLLLVLLLAVTTFGCSGGKEGGGEEQEEKGFTVGLAMHNQTADFTVQLYQTFKEAIEKEGGTVVMTDANGEASKQVDQINDLVIQQVDYICVCPVDSSALGAALKEANDAGIPVINMDSKVCDEDLGKVKCVISSANYEGGYTLGEWIVSKSEDGDKYGYIDYPQIEAIAIRYQGMVDAVKASGKNIEMIQVIYNGDTVKQCEDLCMANPDIDGIIGLNDAFALAAYSVLAEYGVEDPLTAGFDGSPAGKQSIDAGELTGTVVNSPVQLALAGANACVTLKNGGNLDFEIPVKMWVIDKDNVAEYGLEGWN